MMKSIKDYEGLYSVTEDGRIWSHERIAKSEKRSDRKIFSKWLKPFKTKRGYLQIGLYKNLKQNYHLVHRLVAQTFLLNLENKPEINHLNGVTDDNRVENLEYCTRLENQRHAIKNGFFNNKGENHVFSKLTWKQVDEMRKNHPNRKNGDKVWEKYEIKRPHYYLIISGKRWKREELK